MNCGAEGSNEWVRAFLKSLHKLALRIAGDAIAVLDFAFFEAQLECTRKDGGEKVHFSPEEALRFSLLGIVLSRFPLYRGRTVKYSLVGSKSCQDSRLIESGSRCNKGPHSLYFPAI